MKKVFKYTLGLTDVSVVDLPLGAEILKVGEQNGSALDRILYIWALVDDAQKHSVTRRFRISGTGHDVLMEDRFHTCQLKHLDTIFTQGGHLMWHIFEII